MNGKEGVNSVVVLSESLFEEKRASKCTVKVSFRKSSLANPRR